MRRMLKTVKATLIAGAAALAAASVATPAQAADRFRVEITNMRSGLKADVIWASQAEHQGVFLWPNNSSASQEFDLLDSGGGYFRIRARHSGQCLMLDWSTGSYTNGTPVIQHPYCSAGYSPAEWRVGWASPPRQCGGGVCSTSSASYPVLINRKTGKCLDARNDAGGTPRVQAILQQWTCIRTSEDWNAGNQLWSLGGASL